MSELLEIEKKVFTALRTIYDPEIPVNIYDLGLIYEVEADETKNVNIKMTLTAPNCPIADDLVRDVHDRVAEISGVTHVNVELVFDPPWDKTMMSEEAKLELGFL